MAGSAHDVWRSGFNNATNSNTSNLTVTSTAASTAVFASETYALRMAYSPPTSTITSTPNGQGVYYKVIDATGPAITSGSGTFLPPGWVELVQVTPGQRVTAICPDSSTYILNVVELTN